MWKALSLLTLVVLCADVNAAPKGKLSEKQRFVKRIESQLKKGIAKRTMRESTRMFLKDQIRRAQSDSFVVKRGRLFYIGGE